MRFQAGAILLIAGALAGLATPRPVEGRRAPRHNRIIDLLSQNKVLLGWFAPARTAEAAKKAAADADMDFIFFNMEQVQSYNPAELKSFMLALQEGAPKNPNSHPLMARLPVFHDDPAAARQRTAEILNLGAHAIVFPAMESREEAEQAIAAMRFAPSGTRPDDTGGAPAYWGMTAQDYKKKADVYPLNPDGELASFFIIESEKGIANSREITRVKPTIATPGPGTLRRVYQGDMEKVENAIQTQLASCKEFNVPCGITANAKDIEKRLREGFRVIIIYDRDYPETIKVGRQAAGRTNEPHH
jgi:2-keto-3-deoxy-L-rhamnonate aldolase RhmA